MESTRFFFSKLGVPRRKLLQLLQLSLVLLLLLLLMRQLLLRPLHKADKEVADLVDWIDQRNAGPPANYELQQEANDVEEKNEEDPEESDEMESVEVWNFNATVRRDWHNWTSIRHDLSRRGPGEGGAAYSPDPDEEDTLRKNAMFKQHGFNAYASDHISVTRSVKDIRHKSCYNQEYSASLPTVSVIIPFIDEHLATLKRTFHSVLNRSPKEVLKEIILVDDASTKADVGEPLDMYISSDPSLSNVIRVVRLPERGGLVIARQTGAREASGQVLIFLDSHTEANYNWLPPLLDPIAADFRTASCPFIDVIDMDTFEYRAQDEGKRGSFDWELFYKRLDLLPEALANPAKPFESPVMAGGLFAIAAKFFWELGGYDEGLYIWGGEQYELSFKIWQCGGRMVDTPCSRVGHIYRKFAPFNSGGKGNYLGRNLKRVAEVWMDEYKDFVYQRRPGYRDIDPGDLTKQKALRDSLHCKPFKWFMENIAFDQPLNYPPVEPPEYASGKIKNVAIDLMCLGAPKGNREGSRFFLQQCEDASEFVLNWHKDIRVRSNPSTCLDVSEGGDRAPIKTYPCHGGKGNQLWKYDWDTQWLVHGVNPRCLDMDSDTMMVFVTHCQPDSEMQRWKIDRLNVDRIKQWDIQKP